jgi:hypothetical protein
VGERLMRFGRKMKPFRYFIYGLCTMLTMAGLYLMTTGERNGTWLIILGAGCSHIGRPPKKQSGNRLFLPVNRLEWIVAIFLIVLIPLLTLIILTIERPPAPIPDSGRPLSPVQGLITAVIFLILIGAKFWWEKRNAEPQPDSPLPDPYQT